MTKNSCTAKIQKSPVSHDKELFCIQKVIKILKLCIYLNNYEKNCHCKDTKKSLLHSKDSELLYNTNLLYYGKLFDCKGNQIFSPLYVFP